MARMLTGLRRVRDERAMSQQELEEACGVPQASISALELLKRSAQPGTMRKLAEALGVEPAELMREVK